MSSVSCSPRNFADFRSLDGLTIGWNDGDEEILHTGSIGLDAALGIGGFPRGKLVEIYGETSSGKTTLALAAVAQCQKRGGRTALLELENKLSKEWVRRSGINPNNTLFVRCSEALPALKVLLELVHSGQFELVVVDSIAALLPFNCVGSDGNVAGEIERLLERALPLIAAEAAKSHTCLLMLNQVRVDYSKMFGDCTFTPGGHVLRHTSSIRIHLCQRSVIDRGGNTVVGTLNRATVKKNSLAGPHKTADLAYTHARGLDELYEAVCLGKQWGLFDTCKVFIEYNGTKLGQSDLEAYDFLLKNSEVATALLKELSALHSRPQRLPERTHHV